jgi:hypothetical protein
MRWFQFDVPRLIPWAAMAVPARLNLNQMAGALIQTVLAEVVPTLAVLVGILINS